MNQRLNNGVRDPIIDEVAAAWNPGADAFGDGTKAGALARILQLMTLPTQPT